MYTQILPQLWMLVPKAERDYIAEVFSLTRAGITEVKDQEVITDGYTANDLAGITLEKMTVFIGSEETFPRAWELTVAKAHSVINPPVGIIASKVAEIEQEIKHEVSVVEEAVSKKLKKAK